MANFVMTDSAELIKLYSEKILALAADIPLTERLESPDATSKVRSPLCGSTVTVDIKVGDGIVTGFGQNVKACALGQAAASVVGRNIIGCQRVELSRARSQLKSMLDDNGPPPSAPFAALHVLQPAKDYKNRHASIMLALDASLLAFDQAISASPPASKDNKTGSEKDGMS